MRSANCRSTSVSEAVSYAAPTRAKPTIHPPANAITSRAKMAISPNVRRIIPMTASFRGYVYYVEDLKGQYSGERAVFGKRWSTSRPADDRLLGRRLVSAELDLNPLAVLHRVAFEARRSIGPHLGGCKHQPVVERLHRLEHRR